MIPAPKFVKTPQLKIGYLDYGDSTGWPCILNHGFPYDVHAYVDTAPLLVASGARVLIPYLRGYGPTEFLSPDTPRSGEQAVLAADLLALMDALGLQQAVLGGYDWGGRAACIVSALWPDRVVALVSGNSYNIQNIARCAEPETPAAEASYWYQYFFHHERGRQGLLQNRRGFALALWQMWSPGWDFDDACFERTALAFDNPDFVDVVIHSYRHRYGLVAGDPAVASIETQLVSQPDIVTPSITIDGDRDGVNQGTESHAAKFRGPHEHRVWKGAGHNLPQEKPVEWADAICTARSMAI